MIDYYIVYLHRRKDTGDVFYVGKGKPTRPTMKAQRSLYWNRVVEKSGGYEVEYVASGLTEVEAFEIERRSIAAFRSVGVKLCNLTDGGEGVSGHVHSVESRRKMSESHKGKAPPNKGKKVSDKVRQKLRLAHLGKPLSEAHNKAAVAARVGIPCSDKTKLKLSLANTGYKHTEIALSKMRRPIICLTTGIKYNSVTQAASATRLYTSNISKCCKGTLNKTGGLQWKYAEMTE